MSVSFLPRSTRPDISYNRDVAVQAEELGFDFLLSAGRWKGTGGELDAQGECMDTFTWATAIALATQRIKVLSTVHPHFVHPILCAKLGASIDHVSGGRWGMNVVTGWNQPELAMFGLEHPPEHLRHKQVQEWIDIVKLLWTQQDFDYAGDFYTVNGGYLNPKPPNAPTLMNAGVSDASRELSAQHMDYYFVNTDNHDRIRSAIADVDERAARYGRTIETYTTAVIIARDTERAARAALQRIIENTDWVCVDNILRIMSVKVHAYSEWERRSLEERLIVGAFAPIIFGTPKQVAAALEQTAATGVAGVMLEWFDYESGLRYFGEKVLPLLEDVRLRDPGSRAS